MLWIAIISLAAGIFFGAVVFPPSIIAAMDSVVSLGLNILVLSVGIEIASDSTVWAKLRENGLRVLVVPLGIIIGSVLAGLAAGLAMGIEGNVSAAISSGMGWYSLSAVIIKDLAGSQAGTTAFLTNIFRELLAFAVIPFVAKYIGPYAAIAPGGATAMDTTLPLITRCTDDSVALVSVMTGVICTSAVPILVPLVYNLL